MIEYPDLNALSLEAKQVMEGRSPLNVFRMVMHSPGFAKPYFGMADATRNSVIPAPLRELIILRVGFSYEADYETFHHQRIARSVGLSEAGITAAQHGADTEGLSDQERCIIRWTDSLLNTHRLVGRERDQAIAEFGLQGLAEIVFIVGFYQQVCNYLLTFEIAIEGQQQ